MRTWSEISRSRLAANYQSIRAAVGSAIEIAAVVKADAYGHGAAETAAVLQTAGAGWFAVTSVGEAIELRRAAIGGRILVLTGCADDELDALQEYDLTPMVQSVEQLQALAEWARRQERVTRLHLEFDTGMGRLGIPEAEAGSVAELAAAAPHLDVEGLATHFASAEDFASSQTDNQVRRFHKLEQQLAARGIRPRLAHMANSAALAYRPATWASMARPGLALYGYLMPATATAAFEVAPVLAWRARVITVKEFPAGVPLGYNAGYRTERPMRVGVIAAGYADGLDRRLSNGGPVLVAGRRAQIVGLVSMDVSLIDLSDSPEVRAGDAVTLLGQDGAARIDAIELAERCGTIPYEMLCRLGRRVPRYWQD